MTVRVEKSGSVWTVIHDRPAARNAMDPASADALTAAFLEFDADKDASVAVFYGAGGAFCAGWDLQDAADTHVSRHHSTRRLSSSPLAFELPKHLACSDQVVVEDLTCGVEERPNPRISNGVANAHAFLATRHDVVRAKYRQLL